MTKELEIYSLYDMTGAYGHFDEALERNIAGDMVKAHPALEKENGAIKGTISTPEALALMSTDLASNYSGIQISSGDIVSSAGLKTLADAAEWTMAKTVLAGAGSYFGPQGFAMGLIAANAGQDIYNYASASANADNPDVFWSDYLSNLEETKNSDSFFSNLAEGIVSESTMNKAGVEAYKKMYGQTPIKGAAGTIGSLVGNISTMAAYGLVGGGGSPNAFIGTLAFDQGMSKASAEMGLTGHSDAALKAGFATGMASAITGAIFMKGFPKAMKWMGSKGIDGAIGTTLQQKGGGFMSTALGKGMLKNATKVIPEQAFNKGYAALATYGSGGMEMAGWMASEDALEKFMLGEEFTMDWQTAGINFLLGMGLTGAARYASRRMQRAKRIAAIKEGEEIGRRAKFVDDIVDGVEVPVGDLEAADKVVGESLERMAAEGVDDATQEAVVEAIYVKGKVKPKGAKLAPNEIIPIDDIDAQGAADIVNGYGREVAAQEEATRETVIEALKNRMMLDNKYSPNNMARVMTQVDDIFPNLRRSSPTPIAPDLARRNVEDILSKTPLKGGMTTDAKDYAEAMVMVSQNPSKAKNDVRMLIKEANELVDGPVTEEVLTILKEAKDIVGKNVKNLNYSGRQEFVRLYTKDLVDNQFTPSEMKAFMKKVGTVLSVAGKQNKKLGANEVRRIFGE